MIENIVFLLFIPSLSIGIILLSYYIRKNKRYDILFGINWDSIPTKNQSKLLNWITSIAIIFGILSTIWSPVIHLTSLNELHGLLIYFGIVIVITILVIVAIERHSIRF